MAEPILLATWTFGQIAARAGWPHLVCRGGGSLDAVEQACRAVEADPSVTTVGYGGQPDAAGEVTLDASIMLSPDRCGSVACVRRFMHPVSIARLVMEKTPHVMLVGQGAEDLARRHGLVETDLLTDSAREAYLKWRAGRPASPGGPGSGGEPDAAGHDTVGVLALDQSGVLAGACSTSGLPLKMPGRVGDSPIIGHGLYVDPLHGAAVATGTGELIMGVCGTFLAVECMRRGASPQDAVLEVLRRVRGSYHLEDRHQAAVIAINPEGRWAAGAVRPGFVVAVADGQGDRLVGPPEVFVADPD